MNVRGWGKGGRAYLVNERRACGRMSSGNCWSCSSASPLHVVIVFTTTVEGQERVVRGLCRRFPAVIPLFAA